MSPASTTPAIPEPMPALPEPSPTLVKTAQAVIPLLKEYTEKLQKLSRRATKFAIGYLQAVRTASPKQVSYRNELKALKKRFTYLRPAAVELARRVSPMVEHGRLDDLTRLELRLRLAEFEGVLLSMDDEMAALDANIK